MIAINDAVASDYVLNQIVGFIMNYNRARWLKINMNTDDMRLNVSDFITAQTAQTHIKANWRLFLYHS
jgi:hypothetical protein